MATTMGLLSSQAIVQPQRLGQLWVGEREAVIPSTTTLAGTMDNDWAGSNPPVTPQTPSGQAGNGGERQC